MVWVGRGKLQRLRRLNTPSLVLLTLVSLVVYNEFLDYFIYSLWWPQLHNDGPAEDNVRVLFVADPQLLGLVNEDPYFGPITRWDNDRYLSRTFHMAYSATRPDVVIFMGDLLDEGSTSRGEVYRGYHDRFSKVFRMRNETKRIYLAGDNDVGGEAFDVYEPGKVAQFEKYFNKESGINGVKFVDFIHMNFQYGMTYDSRTRYLVEHLRKASQGKVRLLLNHMGILQRYYSEYDQMLLTLQPSLIFTAHNHKSYIITCENCKHHAPDPAHNRERVRLVSDSLVYPFPLEDEAGFTEVVIPTCSYRMGVENMGYGAARIASSGSIEYTVLWVPPRYRQLWSYIIVPAVLLVLLIVRCVITTCYTYRREFCDLSEEEIRRRHPDMPNFSGCLGYATRAIHFALFCVNSVRRQR